MRWLLVLALVGCGGGVELGDAGEDAAADVNTASPDGYSPSGKVCITDQINGAGFTVDGGCEVDASCVSDDGSVGICR